MPGDGRPGSGTGDSEPALFSLRLESGDYWLGGEWRGERRKRVQGKVKSVPYLEEISSFAS